MILRLSLLTLNGLQKGLKFPLYQGQIFHGSVFGDQEMLENHAIIGSDSNHNWTVRTGGSGNPSGKIRMGYTETDKISLIPGVIFHLGQTGFKVVEIPVDREFDPFGDTISWIEHQSWDKKKAYVNFFVLPLRLNFIKGPQAGEFYTLSYAPRILGFNQTDLNLLEPGLPHEAVHFTIDNLRPKIKKGTDFKVLINDFDLLAEHFVDDGDIIKIGTNVIEISILK